MIHCENIICMGPHGAQVSVIDWRRLHMPRSLSRGVSEMHTRCAYCGGKFGLVRQQWFQTQFLLKALPREISYQAHKGQRPSASVVGFLKSRMTKFVVPIL